MKDMRKYERFTLRLRGKIEVVDSANGKVRDVVTSNVSAGGAFFRTTEPIAEGSQVKLELVVASEGLKELTGAQGLIKVGGTVSRSGLDGTAICFRNEHELLPFGSW